METTEVEVYFVSLSVPVSVWCLSNEEKCWLHFKKNTHYLNRDKFSLRERNVLLRGLNSQTFGAVAQHFDLLYKNGE